jgi:hypothetical protein
MSIAARPAIVTREEITTVAITDAGTTITAIDRIGLDHDDPKRLIRISA